VKTESAIASLYMNIGKIITSSLDVTIILEGIMEEIRIYFDAENWSLMRLDPATNELFFVIVKGIDSKAVELIRISQGEGIAGLVAKTGESIFVPDTSTDRRFTDKVDIVSGFKTKSIIAVPIKYNDTVYGVIELINRNTGGIFSDFEHVVLKSIADFSAIAFANAALYERAVKLGITDPLTGLFNRARLDEVISECMKMTAQNERRSRESHYAIVIVIDVNNFKEINDKYGHREGDNVLRETADRVRSVARTSDMIFRIGGDEFLILIMENTRTHLKPAAERLNSELEILSHFNMDSGCEVTFSYGISAGKISSLPELIHSADIQMYKNKKSYI
jgi:diguanylate cyclase (GGDEF)-like protein